MDLSWIPAQEDPFHTLVLEVPGRELRTWVQLEAARQNKILFNTVLREPETSPGKGADGLPIPELSTLQGVVLDVLSSANEGFFSGELELLGSAIGTPGSSGRSLRLVRHALQVSSLFHSYLKMGLSPAEAPSGNVNKGWQLKLWNECMPELRRRTELVSARKSMECDPLRGATIARFPDALPVPEKSQMNVLWRSSTSTRAELRWVAATIVDLLAKKEIADLSMVAVVLPPSSSEEYAAQVSGIFSDEFKIPFVLHESLKNRGTGYARAFFRLLEVLQEGSTRRNIKELLELEAFSIARSAEEEELLSRWVDQLGVVHGLTAVDLEGTFVPEDERAQKYHWLQAVDKLCELALSVPDANSRTGVARGMFPLVQRLVKFVDMVAKYHQEHHRRQKTLADWATTLQMLSLQLFEENLEFAGPAERGEFESLLRIIKGLDLEHSAGKRYDSAMVTELLRRPLLRGRARRTGGLFQRGVGVFALRPGSLRVPFTHVFLTGAEDGQLPRIDRIAGTHLFPQKALALPEALKHRDVRALIEMLAHPGRRIFVSHVERNIANGEKKRPSHRLKMLLPDDVAVLPAPVVLAGAGSNPPEKIPERSNNSSSVSGELESSGPAAAAADDGHPSAAGRRVSMKALEDVLRCPVLACAEHRLLIGRNPVEEEKFGFPDVEFGFHGRGNVVRESLAEWLVADAGSDVSVENCLIRAIDALALSRALPAGQFLADERELLSEMCRELADAASPFRPAVQFTCGRLASVKNAVALPELNLPGGISIAGRLPALVHISNGVATALVMTGQTPPEDNEILQVPLEYGSRAMMSLCILQGLASAPEGDASNAQLAALAAVERWRIAVLFMGRNGFAELMTKNIDRWDAKKSMDWLCTLTNVIANDDHPALFPLKQISGRLANLTIDQLLQDDLSGPDAIIADKILEDFQREDLGKFPYDGKILLGNFIMNMPLEESPSELLLQRHPWIVE